MLQEKERFKDKQLPTRDEDIAECIRLKDLHREWVMNGDDPNDSEEKTYPLQHGAYGRELAEKIQKKAEELGLTKKEDEDGEGGGNAAKGDDKETASCSKSAPCVAVTANQKQNQAGDIDEFFASASTRSSVNASVKSSEKEKEKASPEKSPKPKASESQVKNVEAEVPSSENCESSKNAIDTANQGQSQVQGEEEDDAEDLVDEMFLTEGRQVPRKRKADGRVAGVQQEKVEQRE